jgi:hypothetical protein
MNTIFNGFEPMLLLNFSATVVCPYYASLRTFNKSTDGLQFCPARRGADPCIASNMAHSFANIS